MHVMDVLSASSLLFSACAGRTSALSSCGRILNKEPWSPEEVALVEELTTQIGPALEKARLLLEETRQRAAWEHVFSEIAARVRTPMDMDTILQTADKELGQVLRAAQVSVYLAPAEAEAT